MWKSTQDHFRDKSIIGAKFWRCLMERNTLISLTMLITIHKAVYITIWSVISNNFVWFIKGITDFNYQLFKLIECFVFSGVHSISLSQFSMVFFTFCHNLLKWFKLHFSRKRLKFHCVFFFFFFPICLVRWVFLFQLI